MELEMLQGIIGSMGFPIACVCAMFWMWNKEREDHKAEMANVTDALNNNTLALQKLEGVIAANGHKD